MSTVKEPQTMEELVSAGDTSLIPFRQGDVTEVTINSIGKTRMVVDVQGLCLGIVPEREYSFDYSELKPGDKVVAYVLSVENDDGHVILSLRRADRERLWRTLEEKTNSGELLTVKVSQANRGGLIVQYGDIEGFLPVSQLSSAHYPRVSGGDRDRIMSKLNDIVGQTLRVKIITFDRAANKLIFSEKAAGDILQEETAQQFKIGQKITGKITGIVDFGVFVNIGEMEGLVHVSEISWDHIDDPRQHFQVGQEVETVVIGVEGGRVSLSMKRLLPDPWNKEISSLKEGEIVEGEITRVTPFGVFVKLTDRLEGLVHISEISDEKVDPQSILKEGEKHSFRILSVEPETRKISLSLKQASATKVKKEDTAKEKKTTAKKTSRAKKETKKEE